MVGRIGFLRKLVHARRKKLLFQTYRANRNNITWISARYCQTVNNSNNTSVSNNKGFWDKLIQRHGAQHLSASENYNRWRAVPLAVSTHLCLGACYAWSIFNEPLTRELGVVASSASDWPLPSVVTTFVGIVVCQGISMATCGKWIERVGPRIAGVTGALLYGGGMCLGSVGVLTHSLPLIYLGYGAISGIGMGISYLPPVATLVKWFPDRRGLATGMAVMGFGGGAVIVASLKKKLLAQMYQSPQYIGPKEKSITKWSDDGRLLAQISNGNNNNQWQEVVLATKAELSRIGLSQLQEGLYVVGTGSTGVAPTMAILGLGYLAVCAASSMFVKLPPPGYVPKSLLNNTGDAKKEQAKKALTTHVHIDDVMKTPQFWLLWTTFLATATAGLGLMSCAKDVLQCGFGHTTTAANMGPAAFAAAYVQALSVANLGGRIIWATTSDKIGRKATFALYTLASLPIYCSLPYIISTAVFDAQSTAPLYLFYGSTMLLISFFGGGYSTIPAYESDMFGTKFVASVHGRMMTASAVAGVLGPMIFSKWRAHEEHKAIHHLTEICDNNKFNNTFGTTKENIKTLIESKQINITKLLDICPPDTIDPTPFLYDPAFKTMGVVMGIGAIGNLIAKPVNKKWLRQT